MTYTDVQYCIGIDLGTSNSCCAISENGKTRLIPNRLGGVLTPSVVSVDNDCLMVGHEAKERRITHSDVTFASFKRDIGSSKVFGDSRAPFRFSSEELSSLILKSLKSDIDSHLGPGHRKVVISVPAYFPASQRSATVAAAKIAGFEVMQLISEPTAAALSYGIKESEEGVYIVLDFGGGTFDVTLLELFEGILEVRASAGDCFLGGDDLTHSLVRYFLDQNHLDYSSLSAKERERLLFEAEKAKILVSANENPYQIKIHDYDSCEITADVISDLLTPFLLRAKDCIHQALSDGDTDKESIRGIFLVGGSTRLPHFRKMISLMFGRIPFLDGDPDTVVARGAAIQAERIQNKGMLRELILTDVCPYSLGTNVVNKGDETEYFSPVIERNTTIPVSREQRYFTAYDNQHLIEISILQGECLTAAKNAFLGKIRVPIPKAPAGEESILVRFSYDPSGLLEVDVTVESTGKITKETFFQGATDLSPSQKDEISEKLKKLKFHPRDSSINVFLLNKGERLFSMLLGDAREQVADAIMKFRRILESQDERRIKDFRIKLAEFLDSFESPL